MYNNFLWAAIWQFGKGFLGLSKFLIRHA